MSQFLKFIETMSVSPQVVKLHTKDKYEGMPVTVHIRRHHPNQWQWQFEGVEGKGVWHNGDLGEIKNVWRILSLL